MLKLKSFLHYLLHLLFHEFVKCLPLRPLHERDPLLLHLIHELLVRDLQPLGVVDSGLVRLVLLALLLLLFAGALQPLAALLRARLDLLRDLN